MQAISPSELSNSESHTATALLIHQHFSYELKIEIEIPVSSSIQISATTQEKKPIMKSFPFKNSKCFNTKSKKPILELYGNIDVN